MSDNSEVSLSLNLIVQVEEVRRGLFRIRWEIDDVRDFPYKATFKLCGSQLGQSYVISCYPKRRHNERNIRKDRPPFYVRLSLKKTLKEEDQQQELKVCEQQECLKPIYVWVSRHRGHEAQLSESIESGTWRLWTFSIWKQPAIITLWMDFGTSTPGQKSVMKGIAHLFSNQVQCDVQFHLANGKSIGAHVCILSASSPVFAAMFQTGRFEEAQTRKVTIDDVEMNVFNQLLSYLYTGNAPELEEEQITQPLFEVADKYGVETLKSECVDVMLTRLSVNNAVNMLVWSHLHSIPKLFDATMKFVAANGRQICFLPEWMDLMKNYPDLCLTATQRIVGRLPVTAADSDDDNSDMLE